jgi:hypothetical protein
MAKQRPTTKGIAPRQNGESNDSYDRRIAEWRRGDHDRSKVDMREFKTCDFHLAPEENSKRWVG